jgi:hypothetical protein
MNMAKKKKKKKKKTAKAAAGRKKKKRKYTRRAKAITGEVWSVRVWDSHHLVLDVRGVDSKRKDELMAEATKANRPCMAILQ